MRHRIDAYVASICILSLASAGGVYVLTPATEPWGERAALCFAALGFFAQALGYKIGKGAEGDISFLPFLAIALLSPNVIAVATVATAVAITQVVARRDPQKGIFNVAQYALSIALGIIVYR